MSQPKSSGRTARATTHSESSSSEPTSTRTTRRPLLLLAVVGLLLGWGGCGSEKEPTGPAGDAVEEAIRQVAASPWAATLEATRTLRGAGEGWELTDRRDPIHSGFAPYRANSPVVIASDYGHVAIHPHDRGAVDGVVSANAVVYPAAADGADVVIPYVAAA